ncbi:TetR/AcrR family transcriptional regulator [Lentilactobacillus sp. Marseille-Q4993]|uniref:TetR/AcrR family transcriptional regulator n=1 Tax=Lentilactobacillus sp. Marseille-Q4993 TaxID=3039492 RepID=UPI0024BCA2D3|nr:TetR/AcrR family transcriptional regulator [Lentilactobacillus sp. Marseille-Q4993]
MDGSQEMPKTKLAIIDAFLDLLAEEGFFQVTVTDIIKRADINRTTFYQYFSDKYDLLGVVQGKIFDGLMEIVDREFIKDNQTEQEMAASLNNYIRDVLLYLKNHGSAVKALYDNQNETMFLDQAKYRIEGFYPSWRGFFKNSDELLTRYAVEAIVGMMISVIVKWSEGGYSDSVDTIVPLISNAILGMILG